MTQLANTITYRDIKLSDVWQARQRIHSFVRWTPTVRSNSLSLHVSNDCSIYLKLDNLQDIGAFKVRGAANAIQSMTDEERKNGVTTFSTGNHGLAVAYVAKRIGIRAVVCISNDVPPAKVNKIREAGAEIKVVGHSQDDAAFHCYELSKNEGMSVIKPFDDPYVIAGQGTIGLELMENIPNINTAIVPLSGGGLISGVALALKSCNNNIRIIGVSMENGAAMYESIRNGKPTDVEETSTLADSLRGGIGIDNQFTFPMVQSLVDDIVLIPETAIADGMKYMMKEHRMIIEGAAAIGIGAIIHNRITNIGKNAAVIVTGHNVDDAVIHDLINKA